MSLGIPISPKNDFFTALENGYVEPLKGSEYEKNDTLDKYIFEPILPIKKFTHREFKPLLSPIEEEVLITGQEGGNIDDKRLFIAVLLTHGGYSIDNSVKPVTLVTRENAQLIVPGNKFDGYKTLTICGPAPPGQINLGSIKLIDETNDIVIRNIHRFTTLLKEKVSSVEMPEEPILVKPASASAPTPRYSHSHSLSVSASSRGRHKKYKLPLSGISGGAGVSRFSKLSGIVKSVSSSIKSKFFSLVSGCVKIVMNFNVDYAVLDLRDNTYNRIQKHVVDAIICMSRNGILKVDSELFTAFTYSLYKGLQQSDRVFLSNAYPSILVNSVPGSIDYIRREDFMSTMNERYPSVRVLVSDSAFQPNHIEKIYKWNPGVDAHLSFGIRVFSVTFRKKNNNTNTSILPSIYFFDIPVDEIFSGTTLESNGYYRTCLSDLSYLISTRINTEYYRGANIKKILSIIDLSCSSFNYPQVEIPKTTGRVWGGIFKGIGRRKPKLGGGSGGNKTRRKNDRKERKERKEKIGRNKSKIGNRRMRQTRKIKRG